MKIEVYELREVGELGDEYALLRFEVKGANKLRTFRHYVRHWSENAPYGHELPKNVRCHLRDNILEMTCPDRVLFRARPVVA